MVDDVISKVAERLVAAHKSGHRVPVDAEARALAREGAATVQALVAKGTGDHPTGWKVAVIDGTPAYAPMMESVIKGSGASFTLCEEGFLVEIEVAARLKSDLTPRPGKPYSRDEVIAAISEWVVGIELIGSRYQKSPGDAPFPAWLADSMGNAAYIHGASAAASSLGDLSTLRVRWWLDGEQKHDKVGGHPQNDPILPILLNANAPADEFGGFKAGHLITTGSLTVPLVVDHASRIKAEIDGIGTVECQLLAR
jgi:2-keto-4-pentenoate hydratase